MYLLLLSTKSLNVNHNVIQVCQVSPSIIKNCFMCVFILLYTIIDVDCQHTSQTIKLIYCYCKHCNINMSSRKIDYSDIH